MRGADFLSLQGLSGEDLSDILTEALRIKKEGTRGFRPLSGKAVGLLFEKPSTRTRVSFEVAVLRLGGHPMMLTDLQLGRGETIGDTGIVLSRYLDGLVVRTFAQERIETLAAAADVPVLNALTDLCHPCQAMADMLTILEYRGGLGGLRLAYLGDGNNVANSLMRSGSRLAMDVVIATPKGREPDPSITQESKELAEKHGGSLDITNDPVQAATGADVLYTDVWVSMGDEADPEHAKRLFGAFQLNEEMLRMANDDAMVMHCLPAHRGEEITDAVIDGSHSVVWDQAENRLHAQVALLSVIYG
ncbi:MAG: ornithine carbamoyltransferase [Actinobacteria bacterium]|nr:ornithine carbamoyltransferase [Actinomycetota bacterium]MBU1944458.1 ornithine carbamoyltransferase [Actinomycetota bacterium]MBU2688623.1 ornithine carbamoyltransferase [Actinomycetota bacterium]